MSRPRSAYAASRALIYSGVAILALSVIVAPLLAWLFRVPSWAVMACSPVGASLVALGIGRGAAITTERESQRRGSS